ncbi:MAG: hypothetical protein Q8K30_04565 [Candidatus Gracilibacteria bacterium]|nr:hypothetical protein [Candidatus Gracilibacteria bacterium]
MKKVIIIFILFIITITNAYSYTPTDNELRLLGIIKERAVTKSKIKGQLWLKKELISLEKSLISTKDERIKFLLTYIINDRKIILENLIIEDNLKREIELKRIEQITKEEELKKAKFELEKKQIEIKYLPKAIEFFNINGKDITTELKVNQKCTKYFDFVNDIAIKNDFPVELIIATWSIEYNCNLGNPANGFGPFQITSKFYTPGDITLEQFALSIQDFIDFSRNKWNYFNTNKYHDYKTRYGSGNIEITYDNYTLRELRLNSILYNGIKKDTTLDKNTFANTNLNKEVEGPFDGLVTRFLKILKWRIDR